MKLIMALIFAHNKIKIIEPKRCPCAIQTKNMRWPNEGAGGAWLRLTGLHCILVSKLGKKLIEWLREKRGRGKSVVIRVGK